MPRHVATQPPLAQFGPLGPEQTLRPGQTVWRSNGAETEAARAGGRPGGSVKLVAARDGGIVAAGAVGEGAGEIMAMLALAGTRGPGLGELGALALARPSVAAALPELADQYLARREPLPKWRRLPGWLRR
jgi:pyruvate/2-oxoglutarate dehydrogenase complex dihydrolipoamide dehydrogenase (E3) component